MHIHNLYMYTTKKNYISHENEIQKVRKIFECQIVYLQELLNIKCSFKKSLKFSTTSVHWGRETILDKVTFNQIRHFWPK